LWLTFNISAKRKYDKMLVELTAISYPEVEMDANTLAFLNEVRDKWTQSYVDIEGPHSEALKTLGFTPSVSSLVHVFTCRLPEYSFFSIQENKQSTVMGLVKCMIIPSTIDEVIHVSADRDIALLKLKPNLIQIFADEESGFSEEMYYLKESIEDSTKGERLKLKVNE
jgi:hypothetical protein